MERHWIIATPEAMERLGAQLAEDWLRTYPGERCFIALYGNLGAGKTVFVRGLASVLSPGSRVKSPTYTLVNEYRKGPVPLFHFDLYRAEAAEDLESIGFEEYVSKGHCVIEWSEYLREFPPHYWKLRIEPAEDGVRSVTLSEVSA